MLALTLAGGGFAFIDSSTEPHSLPVELDLAATGFASTILCNNNDVITWYCEIRPMQEHYFISVLFNGSRFT